MYPTEQDNHVIVVPEGVSIIREFQFHGLSSLEEIFLPSTIKKIENFAFKDCSSLNKIHFKSAPVEVSRNAFTGCEHLFPDGMIIIQNVLYGYIGTSDTVIIPDHVVEVAKGAFIYNEVIHSVEIPSSVHHIASYAFEYCRNLEKIILNMGLEELGQKVFNACSALKEIYIPDSVKSIGAGAFQDCTQLRAIHLPENLEIINRSIFNGCHSLEQVILPAKSQQIMDWAFAFTPINTIDFSNITYIGSHVFSMCKKIKEIVLTEKLEYVSSHMFSRCYELKRLYIPDSVTAVDDLCEAFADQTDIPYLHISCKLLKYLEDNNKLNAISTYLNEPHAYTTNGSKEWLTYIKRYKTKILKLCISENRFELFQKILGLVNLSETNTKELLSVLEDPFCKHPAEYINLLKN